MQRERRRIIETGKINVKTFLRAKFVLFVSVSNPTPTINGKCEEFFTQNTSAKTRIY